MRVRIRPPRKLRKADSTKAMNIDQPPQRGSHSLEWHKSLDALLNERQAIDAFRVWLRLHRRDDALDFYLAIIAFRKHVLKKDQRAMNMAYAMQKKYICPRTGLCDFLPQKLRQEISHKVVQYRARKQTPPVDIFDRLAPYVWSYLCEQHTLFVSSTEFHTVVKASEAGGKAKMAEITAQRNMTANSRVPPLIGFAKFRCRDSQSTTERERFRAKSEPPAKRAPRKEEDIRRTHDDQDSEVNEFLEPEAPGTFPIRHEREEDRDLFVRILCDRLAPLALQQHDEDRRREENEFRLDLGGDTPSSWDEEDAIPPEALCEWSLAPSARVCNTKGVPSGYGVPGGHGVSYITSVPNGVPYTNSGPNGALNGISGSNGAHNMNMVPNDQSVPNGVPTVPKTKNHQNRVPSAPIKGFMHKSASIAFSESNDLLLHQHPPAAPRLKKFDSLNNTAFRPFLKDHLFAVHTHLVAPLSNKCTHPNEFSTSYHAQAPPPPAPLHMPIFDYNEVERHRGSRCNVYQQFSDSSGFCSSESAHLHLAELNERTRIPRDNSYPFDIRPQEDHYPSYLPVSYKDETGVPFVSRIYSRSMTFGLFRHHFGINSWTSKRFMFKGPCEDGSAPYQWTVVMDDNVVLPVYEGKITAECREMGGV
ncbi:unnamed protein product [Bursaphelenchus okinawaensis]|uniref:RGS domain-containing protein n=1 Tax=Bursaphelenchus okinawaensis TaxID=465554 RepID=A0A811JWM2_9BILA|nr:unnamed protein product [Bursaphelenchus okinawaensis]CAG9085691.1 unnamed protein product [Bursaphelenchus okinawaensis]